MANHPPPTLTPTSPASTLVFCEACGSLQLRAVTKQLQELFAERSIKPNVCGICRKPVQPLRQNISKRPAITIVSSSKQQRNRRKQAVPKALKVVEEIDNKDSAIETSNDEQVKNLLNIGEDDQNHKLSKNFQQIVHKTAQQEKPVSNVSQVVFYRLKKRQKVENEPSNTTSTASKIYKVVQSTSKVAPVEIKQETAEAQDADTRKSSSGKKQGDPEVPEEVDMKQGGDETLEGERKDLEHVDPDLLELMMPSNDPLKPFKCKFCAIDAFHNLKTFQTHVKIHIGKEPREKPYKCIMCYTKFATADECAKHKVAYCTPCTEADMLEIIKWLDNRVVAMMGTAVRVQAPFRCKHCTFSEFHTAFPFIRHQKDNHADKYPGIDLELLMKNGYKCMICDQGFPTLVFVQKHHLRHTGGRPYKCDHEGCDRAFRDKYELRRHLRIHEEKQYICNTCGSRFVTNGDLQSHIRDVHLNIRPFQCPHCDTAWPTKYRMEKHIKRIHLKLKPAMCEICGKSFANKTELNLHKTTHSGEKKYKCDQCDHVTARLLTLKVHKRQHSGEKPFKCDKCDKAFVQRVSLTQHLRRHHGDMKAWSRAGTSGGCRAQSKTGEVTEVGQSKFPSICEEDDTLSRDDAVSNVADDNGQSTVS